MTKFQIVKDGTVTWCTEQDLEFHLNNGWALVGKTTVIGDWCIQVKKRKPDESVGGILIFD
jgi:hypothetical protein